MTDVIEDIQHILQRAVDLLEILIDHLYRRLNENLHRPVNRKTLVRWIAAFIPNPRNPKLHIQNGLEFDLKRYGSCESIQSCLSLASLNDLVEEDLGDNIVRYRIAGMDDNDDNDSVFGNQSFALPGGRDQMTSTPNCNASSCSSAVSSDARMMEVEEELASLRKQIAMLVVAQEGSTFSHTMTETKQVDISQAAALPLPSSPGHGLSSNDSGCDLHRLPSCASDDAGEHSFLPAPPAPPPPPPPPPPAYFSHGPSFADMLSEQKSKLANENGSKQSNIHNDHSGPPRMSDVLKEMTSVKLRAVDRSPGGTPMRIKPRVDPFDPASIIAQALLKKFAHNRVYCSPDSDRENDSSFSSPDFSNQMKQFNQAKTKRRLSLLATHEIPQK